MSKLTAISQIVVHIRLCVYLTLLHFGFLFSFFFLLYPLFQHPALTF